MTLEFLRDKDDTDGSLDMFPMAVQPNARMPVPHEHESWDVTVDGLEGSVGIRSTSDGWATFDLTAEWIAQTVDGKNITVVVQWLRTDCPKIEQQTQKAVDAKKPEPAVPEARSEIQISSV